MWHIAAWQYVAPSPICPRSAGHTQVISVMGMAGSHLYVVLISPPPLAVEGAKAMLSRAASQVVATHGFMGAHLLWAQQERKENCVRGLVCSEICHALSLTPILRVKQPAIRPGCKRLRPSRRLSRKLGKRSEGANPGKRATARVSRLMS